MLAGRVGETFAGTVTDIDKKRGARIQLADPAVITRVPADGLEIGGGGRPSPRRSRSGAAPDALFDRLAFSRSHKRRGRLRGRNRATALCP